MNLMNRLLSDSHFKTFVKIANQWFLFTNALETVETSKQATFYLARTVLFKLATSVSAHGWALEAIYLDRNRDTRLWVCVLCCLLNRV